MECRLHKENIEINLPEEWRVVESSDRIENEAFFMKGKFSYVGNKVLIAYEYEALKDHVAARKQVSLLKVCEAKMKISIIFYRLLIKRTLS